jgi:MFS family permease
MTLKPSYDNRNHWSELFNYYGWVIVLVGAGAMAATLPGRTHGIGRITAPLLEDLQVSPAAFAWMNLFATLAGSLFCFPCGWIIDRGGIKTLLGIVVAALGGTIVWMSQIHDPASLAFTLFLTRALGQSMLSVISISIVARWFQRRLGLAMGIYTVLMGLMMGTAMGLVNQAVTNHGWRTAWFYQGMIMLCAIAPLLWLFASSAPRDKSLEFAEADTAADKKPKPFLGATWQEALLTPCFWVFSLAISFFGMLSSGISLFQEYVLRERGFGVDVLNTVTTAGPIIGMFANLICGALAMKLSLPRLLAGAMLLMGASLATFPFISELWQIYGYTIAYGIAGGMITVLFFSVWGKAYPGADLGRIQAIAQMMTVFASAAGPVVVQFSKASTGSYVQVFTASAIFCALLGVTAWFTPLPAPSKRPAARPPERAITPLTAAD